MAVSGTLRAGHGVPTDPETPPDPRRSPEKPTQCRFNAGGGGPTLNRRWVGVSCRQGHTRALFRIFNDKLARCGKNSTLTCPGGCPSHFIHCLRLTPRKNIWDVQPMLVSCWASVGNAGPTRHQHWKTSRFYKDNVDTPIASSDITFPSIRLSYRIRKRYVIKS